MPEIDKQIIEQTIRTQRMDATCNHLSMLLTQIEDIAIAEKEKLYNLQKKKDPQHRDVDFEITLANWQRRKF